jgi:hypothetical protein
MWGCSHVQYLNAQNDSKKDEYVSIARVEKGDKIGYINGKGEEIVPVEFDEGSYGYQLQENRITVRKGKNWYIYDIQGKLLLDLKDKYKYVGISGDHLFFVSKKDIHIWNEDSTAYSYDFEELNFIDVTDKHKIRVTHGLNNLSIEYPSNIRYQNGFLRLPVPACERCASKLIGFADTNGKVILQPDIFPANSTYLFNEGLLFTPNSKYSTFSDTLARFGFINPKGEWVIEPTYLWDGDSRFVDGAAIVDSTIIKNDPISESTSSNSFLINRKGKRVFPRDIQVDANTEIIDSVLIVTKCFGDSLKYALAKTDGSFITDFKFDLIRSFEGFGHYATMIGKDHMYLNKNGKQVDWEVSKITYSDTTSFSAYTWTSDFEYGLACIYDKDRRAAVIDMDGNIILPPYDKPVRFEGGLIKALLSYGNSPEGLRYQYYDRKGKPIQFKEYDKIYEFRMLKL